MKLSRVSVTYKIIRNCTVPELTSGRPATDLPANYSFEIHKTVYALRKDKIRCVALQMPEGLMIYGPIIADILEEHTYPETPEGKWEGMTLEPLLLADVTYGACCIDDFTAKEMGAEMIVHYGHSCLSESGNL